MHAEAYDWIKACRKNIKVAELGSRNVNGSVRDLFPDADYTGVDMAGTKAEGVDIQADAKTWDGGRKRYDIVVTTEALEHEEQWREILATAHRILKPGGYLFVTCAGTGRESHSVDGGPLKEGEYYGNVSAPEMSQALYEIGFVNIVCQKHGNDTQASAQKKLGVQ